MANQSNHHTSQIGEAIKNELKIYDTQLDKNIYLPFQAKQTVFVSQRFGIKHRDCGRHIRNLVLEQRT